MNLDAFYEGREFEAYTYYGAHVVKNGVEFRVYAPNAKNISIEGDFNNWSEYFMPRDEFGIYTVFFQNAREGMCYKYRIYGQDGSIRYHSDPYGYGMDVRPDYASVIRNLDCYQFKDKKWMSKRNKNFNQPLNIYEIHLGSWKRKSEDETGWYSYVEIVEELIAYVKENGFTHIEIMPLCEHPADCSWGYQITGFFSPTSRYGTAVELMEFIDRCHQSDIGVIMDFVPVHFAVDEYALGKFDGTALYEYPYADIEKSEWGTYNFDYAKGEVRSFLQSCMNYWITKYHIDGIRMDAISNALYWQGNTNRGINQNGVEFLRNMNQGIQKLHPDVMLIAEDSTTYPKVTAPVEYDGLGFDYKWDMGFMNDTLEYFKLSPQERSNQYHRLTFSMHYFYFETFLLPFSHDENVHEKATIIQKMWGDYEYKFMQCKALYAYMFTHPGKKLNFMGGELGQFREWNETKQQDWNLLTYPKHAAFYQYFTDLSRLYKEKEALYKDEYNAENFKWLVCEDTKHCIYAYQRGKSDGKQMVAVFNFSNHIYEKYKIIVDRELVLKEIINSEWNCYGGTVATMKEKIKSQRNEENDHEISLKMEPFSARIFKVMVRNCSGEGKKEKHIR